MTTPSESVPKQDAPTDPVTVSSVTFAMTHIRNMTWSGLQMRGPTDQFWRMCCPCGVTVTLPLNKLPENTTQHPCGNPDHYTVEYVPGVLPQQPINVTKPILECVSSDTPGQPCWGVVSEHIYSDYDSQFNTDGGPYTLMECEGHAGAPDGSPYKPKPPDPKPGMSWFLVGLYTGGVMEDPQIAVSEKQLHLAATREEAESTYNRINKCSYYYGSVIAYIDTLTNCGLQVIDAEHFTQADRDRLLAQHAGHGPDADIHQGQRHNPGRITATIELGNTNHGT